jgi:hypothetical protein
MPDDELPGKLIVIEGTDGVGLPPRWPCCVNGWSRMANGAVQTGLARSRAGGAGINKAKHGKHPQPVDHGPVLRDRLRGPVEKEITRPCARVS